MRAAPWEGSRFLGWQVYRLFNRRLPRVTPRVASIQAAFSDRALVRRCGQEAMRENCTLDRFREPPVEQPKDLRH